MSDANPKRSYAYNPSYERNQSFNRLVGWLHSHRYRHVLDAVRPVAAHHPNMQVLDIGCGMGKLYDVLHGKFSIGYTGIDPQAGYLDRANERYGANANFRSFCLSATDSSSFDRHYDVVIALETMEHIEGPKVVRIIERIADANPRRFIARFRSSWVRVS